MADKSKGSSNKKANTVKKPAQTKKASKPATKSTKKPAAKAVKPVTQVKVQERQAVPDKKMSDEGKAFDKKIDQMAQKSAVSMQQEEKPKTGLKAIIGIIIIIILGVIAYLFYPREKLSVVKEQLSKEPALPKPEEKAAEPRKEAVKPIADDVVIYKVKYKDQLTEISKQYYGNHKEWKRIYEANKDKIKNPHLIFPGQEFIIPKIKK